MSHQPPPDALRVIAASHHHNYLSLFHSPFPTLRTPPSFLPSLPPSFLPLHRPSPSSSLKPLCFSQKESKSIYSYFLERPNCVVSFPPALSGSCGGGARLKADAQQRAAQSAPQASEGPPHQTEPRSHLITPQQSEALLARYPVPLCARSK